MVTDNFMANEAVSGIYKKYCQLIRKHHESQSSGFWAAVGGGRGGVVVVGRLPCKISMGVVFS